MIRLGRHCLELAAPATFWDLKTDAGMAPCKAAKYGSEKTGPKVLRMNLVSVSKAEARIYDGLHQLHGTQCHIGNAGTHAVNEQFCGAGIAVVTKSWLITTPTNSITNSLTCEFAKLFTHLLTQSITHSLNLSLD